MYSVVNNDKNVVKRKRREKSNYEDDCGVWLSKAVSTKKTVFHCVNGTFKVVEKKNGEYSTKEKRTIKKGILDEKLEENLKPISRTMNGLADSVAFMS